MLTYPEDGAAATGCDETGGGLRILPLGGGGGSNPAPPIPAGRALPFESAFLLAYK